MPKVKYTLTERLRTILKEPLGFLYTEAQLLTYIQQHPQVISVGDEVTATLLSNDIFPLFCVIDFISKRKEIDTPTKSLLTSYGNQVICVENPPGIISEELWTVIKDACKRQKHESIRIEVTGEEDLAALPAILFASGNVTIIYGLPDKGVVAVPSTEAHKQKVKDILSEM